MTNKTVELADAGRRSAAADFVQSNQEFRRFEERLVIRFQCTSHGFVAWATPGTRMRCRDCGAVVYGPVVDLLYSNFQELPQLL